MQRVRLLYEGDSPGDADTFQRQSGLFFRKQPVKTRHRVSACCHRGYPVFRCSCCGLPCTSTRIEPRQSCSKQLCYWLLWFSYDLCFFHAGSERVCPGPGTCSIIDKLKEYFYQRASAKPGRGWASGDGHFPRRCQVASSTRNSNSDN